jgi:hypothetical protein
MLTLIEEDDALLLVVFLLAAGVQVIDVVSEDRSSRR